MTSVLGQLGPTLERMDYGRALKGELLMNNKSGLQVPYAQPLLDAVQLFDALSVGYALIGGIAAMYYGRSRFTEDVDFVAVTGHMEIFAAHPEAMEKNRFSPDCAHGFTIKVAFRLIFGKMPTLTKLSPVRVK